MSDGGHRCRAGRRPRVGRHRFEPARLVLGLCLLPIAALYALDAVDETDVPVAARFAMLPAALLLAAVVAVIAVAVRRARGPRETAKERETAKAREADEVGAGEG